MSHWYNKKTGSPLHEIKGSNGNIRPTTLRDARKLGLVPSFSTVVGDVLNKPGLLTWIKNEILEAVLHNPVDSFTNDGGIGRWKRKVLEESAKRAKQAAEHGTAIHNELESMLSGHGWSDRELAQVCYPVVLFLKEQFPNAEWVTEKSFANELGYGGCVDLHCPKTKIVLDFKTKMKPKEEIEKIAAFDEHHMQTAAYAVGIFGEFISIGYEPDEYSIKTSLDIEKLSKVKRYNLFIGYGIDKEGLLYYTGIKLTESKDFKREWGMFFKLLEFWQLKNKYVP